MKFTKTTKVEHTFTLTYTQEELEQLLLDLDQLMQEATYFPTSVTDLYNALSEDT